MTNQYPSFRIDVRDFAKGNNSYDNLPDGGILNTSYGANPFSKPGLLSIVPDLGSTVTGSLPKEGILNFGYAKGAVTLDVIALMANSSDDGSFWQVSKSTGALTNVGSDITTQNFVAGFSDTEFYQGSFYTTSKTDIVKNSVDLATRDATFWTGTKGKGTLLSLAPHPLVVYGDVLWIADQNSLHSLDGATATEDVFLLGTDWVITATCVYNGLIYISAEAYFNASGDAHLIAKIFTWDGYSISWLDEWDTGYRINAMKVFENVLYMWTNEYFGYWDDGAFVPLYPLTSQVFKHHITVTDRALWWSETRRIMRYGSQYLRGNKNFFLWIFTASRTFRAIVSMTTRNMLISQDGSSNSSNFYIADVNTPADGASYSQTTIFNARFFKNQKRLKAVTIETETLTTNQAVQLKYYNDQGTLVTIGTFSFAVHGAKSRYTFTNVSGQASTRSFKPVVVNTSGVHIRSIDYYYADSEEPTNS